MKQSSFLPGSTVFQVWWLGIDCPVGTLSESPIVYEELPPVVKHSFRNKNQLRIGSHVLSVRASRCLAVFGICTVDELCKYPAELLLEIRNFGQVSLCEVESALASIGRRLPIAPAPTFDSLESISEALGTLLRR